MSNAYFKLYLGMFVPLMFTKYNIVNLKYVAPMRIEF